MTKPITPDMLPDNAIDAGARDLCRRAFGPLEYWPPHNKGVHEVFKEKAAIVLVGAINAAIESGEATLQWNMHTESWSIIIKLKDKP